MLRWLPGQPPARCRQATGPICLGEELLPGAQRPIAALVSLDRNILFLSNNPTKSPEAYAAKPTRLGVPTTRDRVPNSVATTTSWLKRFHPDVAVFPIDEAPRKRSLAAASNRMPEDPTEIDIVVAGHGRGFAGRKPRIAFDATSTHGAARLVATNPDPCCRLPGGYGEPNAAAVIGAIEG